MNPVRVVILGGGYVAVWGYRSLVRRLGAAIRRRQVEITVVSPENAHAYHGWTGEVLGGIVSLPHRQSALRRLLPHARLVRGEAVRADLDRRTVSVALSGNGGSLELPYDHLVFGTGSRERMESVPGLAQYGWQVKQPAELTALRNHLVGLLELACAVANPVARERLLTIVIAGGGFAGVEMCAAIAEWFAAVRRRYPEVGDTRPRFVLVHAGPALLPQLRPRFSKLADYAAAQLAAYRVEVRLGTMLTAVTAEEAVLSDGSTVVSQTVVSTLGQSLRPLPGTEGLPRDAANRLLTDGALHVQGHTALWTGGDIAHVVHYRTGEPCPSNALWAIKHGERLGDNIARTILGRQARPFRYPGLGQAASLGIGKGAAELYGLQFTGWVGWLMRLGFFLFFMPSRRQALRVLSDWLLLAFGGRDLASLEAGAARAAAPGQNQP